MNTIVVRAAIVAATALLVLVGCAATPGSRPPSSSADAAGGQVLGTAAPRLPAGEVVGAGMVIEDGGSPELCLFTIMESYPPQCDGLPLDGWSWDGLDGVESNGTTRWGSFAVTGTYDGERLTVTQPPVSLALYDPPAADDPTGGEPGTATQEELTAVQEEISARDIDGVGGVMTLDGRVWVEVVWDDGTLQDAADAEFGEGTVIVRSALREAG